MSVIIDEMEEIIICKHCGKPEFYGEMRWLSGFCGCRKCYKAKWQDENHKLYEWDDLDRSAPYPTMEDYEIQNKINTILEKYNSENGINIKFSLKIQSKSIAFHLNSLTNYLNYNEIDEEIDKRLLMIKIMGGH